MIPDYQACMLPLLRILNEHGILSLKECTEYISDIFALTPTEKSELLPSKRQTVIRNRTGWAKFYLNKAGLLETVSRGHYKITPEGQSLLDSGVTSLSTHDLMKIPSFAAFIGKESNDAKETINDTTETKTLTSEKTPEEIIDANYKLINDNLAEEVLEKVLQQSPHFFERLVVDLLMKMGYGAGKITGRTGDEGIDGIIDEDKLGLEKVHIQAKRWQKGNNVGRKELQSFVGALAGQSGRKGVFITTSDFTKEAYEYQPSNVKIAKINGRKLSELMLQYNVGVANRVVYELKRIDLDYFEEE